MRSDFTYHTRGKPKPPPCYKCGKPSTKLCDFRDYSTRTFTDDYGRKITREIAAIDTCDRPMCDDCANHIGEDTDYCDELWVFGEPTEGMRGEIKLAKSLNIPILYIPEDTINKIFERRGTA